MAGSDDWRYDVVGNVPPVPLPDPGRPLHLHCSKDGKRIFYGSPAGVVVRCLPDQYDGTFPPVSILMGSKKPIRTASCSPDGNVIAGGDNDGTLYVWTKEKAGISMKSYGLNMQYVKLNDISFSDDTRRLAAVCGTDKYSKKLATCIVAGAGNAVGKIDGHTQGINAITFRQQKPYRIATAGMDGVFALHEGPPFKLLSSQAMDASGQIYCCRYSPDGSQLVSCNQSGELCFWHPTTGEFDRLVILSELPLFSLAWSADSSRMAVVSEDGFVRIFDATSDTVVHSFRLLDTTDENFIPVGVAWAANSWLCVLTAGGCISGFAIEEAAESTAVDKKTAYGNRLVFQYNGPKGMPCVLGHNHLTDDLVCGTNTGQLMFLCKDNYPHALQTSQLPGATTIRSILVGLDSGFAVTTDSTIRLFNSLNLRSTKYRSKDMSTAAQTRRSSVRRPGGIDAENLTKPEAVDRTFAENFAKMAEGSVSGDTCLRATKPVEILAVHRFEGTPLRVIPLQGEDYCAVVCTNGTIYAYPWKARSFPFQPTWTTKIDGLSAVSSVSYTPDGTILVIAVTASATYPLDRCSFGDLQDRWTGKSTAGENFIEIYECLDGSSLAGLKQIWNFDWHKGEITATSVSFDGIFLASADRKKNIVVSDLRDGSRLINTEWNYHTTTVTCLDWSPDGTKLASGSLDRMIYIWDIDNTGKRLSIRDAHSGEVTALKFLANNIIASVGSDGTMKVFSVIFHTK